MLLMCVTEKETAMEKKGRNKDHIQSKGQKAGKKQEKFQTVRHAQKKNIYTVLKFKNVGKNDTFPF